MKKRLSLVLILALSWPVFSQIKVACVGNSITYGAGIEGRDSLAYPQQLGKILGEEWLVKNFGNSGTTILKKGNKPYWDLPEFSQAQEFMPDVVIIMLGTNDSKPENWDEHHDEFMDDYTAMIKIFQNLESKPMIWLGIPIPVVEDQWTIRKDIVEKDITKKVRQIAENNNVALIDFYSALHEHFEMIPDKIHPDANGSAIMAKEAANVLNKNKKDIVKRQIGK